MPKKNPKHNPVHVERVQQKRARKNGLKCVADAPIRYDRREYDQADWDQMDDIGDLGGIGPITARRDKSLGGSGSQSGRPRCGLCGKTTNLTKTECCDQWICDDEDQYVLFSYDTNSCQRNHDRYTLCASHYHEGHAEKWQDCPECREGVETEMYVWYGTNEYNFEKLPNPPAYKPTRCAKCKKTIHLGEDGYTIKGKEYFCAHCGGIPLMLSQNNSS